MATRNAVEGSWIDAQGTGLSTFAAGSFNTVATDTGQKLSDGSYTMTGATSVEIHGTSLIRQTLGWEPHVTLRDGLARTVAFYRSHMQHYVSGAAPAGTL